jgi:microcystin-dependent protein
MGLESGTWVDDLVVTNPPGGDTKSQGDDHLRLVKNVLRNTFKRASKAFSFPGSTTKIADYSVLSTDDNLTILCDTTAVGATGFNLFFPTLTAGDAGWTVNVVKTNTGVGPVFLFPPSGTINGFGHIRRTIEFLATRVLWTGSVWVATRPNGHPIGTSIPFHGPTLPNGYLWADGAAFGPVGYLELNTVLGSSNTPDLRGRVAVGRDNMGVGAAGRLGAIIAGTTLGASGGTETHILTTAQLATHSHGITDPGHGHGITDPTHGHTTLGSSASDLGHGHGVTDPGHAHGVSGGTQGGTTAGSVQGGGTSAPVTNSAISINSNTTGVTVNSGNANVSLSLNINAGGTGISVNANGTGISVNANGSGAAHNNMPPTLVCNYIVVAE